MKARYRRVEKVEVRVTLHSMDCVESGKCRILPQLDTVVLIQLYT